jgi:hypothetical protein
MSAAFMHGKERHANSLQMCRVADRWGAAFCLRACMDRLTRLPNDSLSCDHLAALLPQLPKSIQQLLQYAAWERKVRGILVSSAIASTTISGSIESVLFYLFSDVHALLTSSAKLEHFHQLPYAAVKAWAAGDDLVVDSENSVVVALGSWITAQKECSVEQQKELSSLIRLKHLTPSMCLNARTVVASPKQHVTQDRLLGQTALYSPTVIIAPARFRFHDLHAAQA